MKITPEIVLSAYTGILICDFLDLHAYIEHLMNCPIFTHEIPKVADQIKEKSRDDYLIMSRALAKGQNDA